MLGQICETCKNKYNSNCYCSPNSVCDDYEYDKSMDDHNKLIDYIENTLGIKLTKFQKIFIKDITNKDKNVISARGGGNSAFYRLYLKWLYESVKEKNNDEKERHSE